jgi:hypothetical protein
VSYKDIDLSKLDLSYLVFPDQLKKRRRKNKKKRRRKRIAVIDDILD